MRHDPLHSIYWMHEPSLPHKLRIRKLPVMIDQPKDILLPNRYRLKGRFRLHHPTEPAVQLWNGSWGWFFNGELHREDGPARYECQRHFGFKYIWAWRGHIFMVPPSEVIPDVPLHKQMPLDWLEFASENGMDESQQTYLKLKYHVVEVPKYQQF